MTRNWVTQPIGGAVVVFAMAITVVACGGASKTAAPATTTTVAGRGARTAAFRSCMSSHGVTLPAGAGGFGGGRAAGTGGTTTGSAPTTTIPAGVTPQQWQAAIAACASQLPTRGNLQNNPQFQLYYNCLQTYLMTHGETTLPPLGQGGATGLFGGGGAGAGATGPTSTTNPALSAARAHCAALRPSFGGGTTTTTANG